MKYFRNKYKKIIGYGSPNKLEEFKMPDDNVIENYFQDKAGDTFWGNKGAGILPLCIKTKRFLVPLRSRSVEQPHTWGVWGGAIDPDEDPEQAAMRELSEESGYHGDFKILKAYIFVSSGGDFQYHNFIGIIEEEFSPTLDWETENSKWVTYEELLELDNKHFGLVGLLKNSKNLIESILNSI
jgi:8-oxo-dGTP pyrophosphatase MutT (NUDIX family)